MNNKKGFVLMETLVVTIFTLFIFSTLYTSVVPLLGRYKELSYYNDIDTTYDLFHIKKFLTSDGKYSELVKKNYQVITCNEGVILNQDVCYSLYEALDIDTSHDEVIFLNAASKNQLLNDSKISVDIKNYLQYVTINNNVILLQNDGYVSYIDLK